MNEIHGPNEDDIKPDAEIEDMTDGEDPEHIEGMITPGMPEERVS